MNYEIIKEQHNYVQSQIKDLQRKQKKYPEGKIIYSKKKRGINWYISSDHKREYIKKDNKKIIEQLVLKKYETALLEEFQKEEKILEKYEKVLNNKISDQMLEQDSVFQKILLNSYQTRSQKIKSWQETLYEKSEYHKEGLIFEIENGEYVRSKSEALIALMLSKNQIPYRYENKLVINGITYWPDFTILHPQTGKIVLWEHLGKMDDLDYVKRNISKLENYCSSGWIPGINLIFTSETSENPLTTKMIEKTIQMYLR